MKKINELVKKEIMEILQNDDDTLISTIKEIDCYTNNFENLRFYDNDEDFFDTYFSREPFTVARLISYGQYNFNDSYVYFDNYGNLSSFNYIDELVSINDIEELANNIMENHYKYDLNAEIKAIVNLLEYEDNIYNEYLYIIDKLMKIDTNGTYDEILKDSDYNLDDAISELKFTLRNLINDSEYQDNKELYTNLLSIAELL